MTDPDLLAVRQLGSEPTDESVSRSWYRITQLEARRAKPNRWRRLMPITAGAAVVLMIAASVIVIRVGEGRWWPADSTPEAVTALNDLAETAEGGTAVPVGAGQLIRSDTAGWAGECSPYACELQESQRESYYDPATGEFTRMISDGLDMLAGPKAQPRVEPEPGIHFPTLEWLAGLPTEPGALLTHLRLEVGEHDRWTVDHQLWDALGSMFTACEIALTPAQRGTFLRAMAGMTGLTMRQVTIHGQNLIAIQHREDDIGDDIYFDPYSGHPVGRGTMVTMAGMTITYASGVPTLESGIISQAVWTQSVTDPLP